MALLAPCTVTSGWCEVQTCHGSSSASAYYSQLEQGTVDQRMKKGSQLQGSAIIAQVTAILKNLAVIPANGFRESSCKAADVLLNHLEGVDTVSISTYTSGCPSICLLAGTAGVGADLLQQQLVMSGSSWSPCLCCMQLGTSVVYKTVTRDEDAAGLPQDWAALYQQHGLRTFLAMHITMAGQDTPAGVLCIASQLPGAFMEESWGLLLGMVCTGLVPLLASPWLSGLSGLAASLVESSRDSSGGFSEFAAAFLEGSAELLQSATHRQLGVRLGLISPDSQEVLLLHHSGSGSRVLNGAADEDCDTAAAADEHVFNSFASCFLDLPQRHGTRLAAAHTMLADALHSKQERFVADAAAFLEKEEAGSTLDMLDVGSELVASMVVVPLFGPGGKAIGGLYVTSSEPGELLQANPVVREQAAMLQGMLQQQMVALPSDWEELQSLCSTASSSCNSFVSGSNVSGHQLMRSNTISRCGSAHNLSGSYALQRCNTSLSGSHALKGFSTNLRRSQTSLSGSHAIGAPSAPLVHAHSTGATLGVVKRMWSLLDKQQECASGYLDELELHSVLGKGGFSTVYAGIWQGGRAAIKVMRVPHNDQLGVPMKSAMEMATLSTLRHPNIVTTYACLTDMVEERRPRGATSSSSIGVAGCRKPLNVRFRKVEPGDLADSRQDTFNIVVMERCDRGNLWQAVKQDRLLHKRLPDGRLTIHMRLLYSVLLDVAYSLKYLHSLGLVHCDVKAENVLLQTASGRSEGFVCKLGDFGLVKLLGDKAFRRNTETSGTLTHLAPERFQTGGLLSAAVDVYSFGILMYELYSGEKPYKGMQSDSDLAMAIFKGMRPQFPASTPVMYRQLAEDCWAANITDRPTFDDIVYELQELSRG